MMNKVMIFDGNNLKVVEHNDSICNLLENYFDCHKQRLVLPKFDDNGINLWVYKDYKLKDDSDITCVIVKNGEVIDYVKGNIVFTKENEGSLDEQDIDYIRHNFSLSVIVLIDNKSYPILVSD